MVGIDQDISRIYSALLIIVQRMQPEMLKIMDEHGITPTQLFVLTFLRKKGSCKLSQLAEQMEVKPSAVTIMVDRLEQNQLVLREHDTKDRRVVNISLTKQGEQKLQTVFEARKKIIEHYFTHLTKEELETTASIFEKLANATALEK